MNLKGKKGVDISAANGNIDISKVKRAGYDFVMIRCGYGSDLTVQDDSQFENNVRKCEAAGIPWGAYLYSYAVSTSDAESEAKHVIRLLKGKKPTLPVAFDMEDADGYKARHGAMYKSLITAICKTFLERIAAAGYYPMLYTGLYWIDDLIDKSVYKKYDLWFAQWNSVCQYSGSNLGIWQYGGETNYLESNSIPGVGVIDKDRCYRDYPSIIKKGGYNGWKGGPDDPGGSSPAVFYRVKADGSWLPEVRGTEDYAGLRGKAITDVAVRVGAGKLRYRVHLRGGGWLPFVSDCDISDFENGYAGNGRAVDAVQCDYTAPKGKKYALLYRVSPLGGSYFDWQENALKTRGMDGYAGLFGKAIDRLQMKLTG